MNNKVIAVDLDGTLAKDLSMDPFNPLLIGPPIPEMVSKIKKAIADGETIIVFTARLADKENHDKIQKLIEAWTKKYIGVALQSTNEKTPQMKEFWDDRARGVEKDTGQFKTGTQNSFNNEYERDHETKNKLGWIPRTAATMPTRNFKKLWHVGTMDITKKQKGSHEGDGLSVSPNPEAWEQINPFTAGDYWELTKPGNLFLDFNRMNKKQKQELKTWGVEQGYVDPIGTWQFCYFDDESDDTICLEYPTLKEVLKEVGYDSIEEAKGNGIEITQNFDGMVPTAKLNDRMGEPVEQAFIMDFLAMVYAEDVLKIDGVWWNETLDVSRYSAPRAVIFNSMVPTWKREKREKIKKIKEAGKIPDGFKQWIKGIRVYPLSNASSLRPMSWVGIEESPQEPLLGYTLRRMNDGGHGYYTVFDGDKPIAAMSEGHISVSPKYRRKGIALAMVKRYMQEFPNYKPKSLNRKSYKLFEKAFNDLYPTGRSDLNHNKIAADPLIPASPEWINKAKTFIASKWKDRAIELGRPEPSDLSGACKFASLFAQALFGGELQGNWDHQFVVLPNGQHIDLTEDSQGSTNYQHDKTFWNNPEHHESLISCKPRVNHWLAEFKRKYINVEKEAVDTHGFINEDGLNKWENFLRNQLKDKELDSTERRYLQDKLNLLIYKRKLGRTAYTAYVLTPNSRNLILKNFPPKFPDVICHHVTFQFGVPKEAPLPPEATITIEGYTSDESLEALVVSVNGETTRPDGSTYHITLSLDRSQGRKPVDSNAVIKDNGWTPIEQPFNVQVDRQKIAKTVYHGSPHEFESFDTNFVGKGEGNQSYGWGLYFTDSEQVAEYYRQALAGEDRVWTLDGNPIEFDTLDNLKKIAFRIIGQPDLYGKSIETLDEQGVSQEMLNTITAFVKEYQGRVKYTEYPKGKIHMVDIPEDDTMLLWDKPLSEQPEKVQKAITNLPKYDKYLTGGDFYQFLSKELSLKGGAKYVSKLMHSYGINGIKYLDANSRENGEGTYNYVIFDSKDIKKVSSYDDDYDIFENHFDSEQEVALDILQEYADHRKDPNYRMKWEVVPAARLIKIWNDYMKTGFVRDENGINMIAGIILTNIAKLNVNTILCGHSEEDPIDYAENILGEKLPKNYFDNEDAFFEDENGAWRISDNALKPLSQDEFKLRKAKTAEEKLQIIDHILNIVHPRSDFSEWFVEGGQSTLNRLAGTGNNLKPKKSPKKSFDTNHHIKTTQNKEFVSNKNGMKYQVQMKDRFVIAKPSEASSEMPQEPDTSIELAGDIPESWKLSSVQPEDIPAAPGTLPIPPMTVRLFHYTKSYDNLASIKTQGLLASHGRGDGGTGSNEPSAGVWASTYAPEDYHLFIEFYASPDQISHRAQYPDKGWRKDPNSNMMLHDVPITQAELDEWAKGHKHVIMQGDVPPSQFLAIHEPWHHYARYMLEMSDQEWNEATWLHDPDEVEILEKKYHSSDEAKALAYVQKLKGITKTGISHQIKTTQNKKAASNNNSPITEDGWVHPDGSFEKTGSRIHYDVAKHMGFDSYNDMYDQGYIRVSVSNGIAFIETKNPMSKQLDAQLENICKRIQNCYRIRAWIGEGDTFEKYEWDGRQLSRYWDENQITAHKIASTTSDLGEAVKKFTASNKSYAILDSLINGGTWLAGGCWILAYALCEGFNGTLYGIFANGIPQHAVAKIGNQFIDADGSSSASKLLTRWKTIEHLPADSYLAPVNPDVVFAKEMVAPPKEGRKEIISAIKKLLSSERDTIQEQNKVITSSDTLNQSRFVNTPQFQAWFNGSKVIDEKGNPQIVYHGTASDFEEFLNSKAQDKEGRRLGLGTGKNKFYFTNSTYGANSAAEWAAKSKDRPGKYPNIMPVYLRITNPIDSETYGERMHQIMDGGKSRDEAIFILDKEVKAEGYDGIKFVGGYAAFYPNQIKSAIGNNGEFNINDNRITASAVDFLHFNLEAIGEWKINEIAQDSEGNKVGEIKTWTNEKLKPEGVYNISMAIVMDDWKGTGLGQQLYDHLIIDLKNRGVKYLYSDTNLNTAGRAAWKRLGTRYNVEPVKQGFRINLKTASEKINSQEVPIPSETSHVATTVGPVYHGTPKDFQDFELTKGTRTFFGLAQIEVKSGAFFFTSDPNKAKNWAENRRDNREPLYVWECYLTMNQTLDLTKPNWPEIEVPYVLIPFEGVPREAGPKGSGELLSVLRDLTKDQLSESDWYEMGIDINGLKVFNSDWLFLMVDSPEVIAALKHLKYDSIIMDEGDDPELGGVSYAVFNKNQIKKVKRRKVGSNNNLRIEEHNGMYFAFLGDKNVATASLSDDGTYLVSVTVMPEYQRQGIGTILYNFIENHIGHSLRPSPTYQTDAAKGFWKKRIGSAQHNDRMFYHGSHNKFTSFSTFNYQGISTEATDHPVWVTPDKTFAKLHAQPTGWLYTVEVNVSNTFDGRNLLDYSNKYYRDPSTYLPLGRKLYEDIISGKLWKDGIDYAEGYVEAVAGLQWDTMQSPEMMRWLKENGYDSFYELGEGHLNLAIFDPNKVKIINIEPIGNPPQENNIKGNLVRTSTMKNTARNKFNSITSAEVMEQYPEIERGEPNEEDTEEPESKERQVYKPTHPPLPPKSKVEPKVTPKKHEPKFLPYVPPTENKSFKRWFGKSKVTDNSGNPLVVYHGTTHDFDTFSMENGNSESYYGKGFYFTSSKKDLSNNYSGEGPDLTNRINGEADKIFNRLCKDRDKGQWNEGKWVYNQPRYGTPDYKEIMGEAEEEAKKKLIGGGGRSMPCYLRIINPVIVDKNGGTWFKINFDIEPGYGMELYNAVIAVAHEFNVDGQKIWNNISDSINGDGRITAYQFEKAFRNNHEADKMYNDEDKFVTGEALAKVFRKLGFDGIILKNADEELDSMKMERGTTHYVVWDASQIKSAIGNIGRYDKKNPSITAGVKEECIFKTTIRQGLSPHFFIRVYLEDPTGDLEVGFIELRETNKMIYVEDVKVDNLFHKNGIGFDLYQRAIALAKQRGCTRFCQGVPRTPAADRIWLKLSQHYVVRKDPEFDTDYIEFHHLKNALLHIQINKKKIIPLKTAGDLHNIHQEWKKQARKQAEEVLASHPSPLPDGRPWIPWELWRDKQYPVGTARVSRSGAVETVTVLPIDKLKWIQEKVNPKDVENYRQNKIWEKAYPSIREFSNRYEIVDGHHRVQAAKESGEKEIKVWLDSRERSSVYADALRKLGYDPTKIASKPPSKPPAFYIEVPEENRDHFWD